MGHGGCLWLLGHLSCNVAAASSANLTFPSRMLCPSQSQHPTQPQGSSQFDKLLTLPQPHGNLWGNPAVGLLEATLLKGLEQPSQGTMHSQGWVCGQAPC